MITRSVFFCGDGKSGGVKTNALVLLAVPLLLGTLSPAAAYAHGVTAGDKGYIMETFGTRIVPFMYLGAKHMVTG